MPRKNRQMSLQLSDITDDPGGFHETGGFPEGGAVKDIPVPDGETLDKEEIKIVAEFLDAVRGRPWLVNTGLDFSIPLAKTLMLANMLAFAGKGTYSFDGVRTDSAVANAHARHGYRKGWEVA